jgi:hypothetical protein
MLPGERGATTRIASWRFIAGAVAIWFLLITAVNFGFYGQRLFLGVVSATGGLVSATLLGSLLLIAVEVVGY